MKNKTLIKFQDVWKIYYPGKIELVVLKDINLEILAGSFLTIMGPSGSGKSTLLNLISCLDVPTKGKIFWEEKDISKFSEDELAQIRGQKIGFIFQQFNLLPNFTALENVMLPMIFQNIPAIKRKERAMDLLVSVGLEKRITHKPTELSGGEQQRVAIARALANEHELIVADEPTGNVDSKTGKQIMNILTDLHQNKKKTIIIVTHDIEIANYSEKIINIKDGQIIDNSKN